MNYCPKCGAYIPDGDTKCVACGFDTARPQEKKEKSSESGHSYEYGYGGAAQAQQETGEQKRSREEYDKRDTGPYAAQRQSERSEAPDSDAAENRGMGVLCYIGPLFLIPLLTHRSSRFIRYHANQGLVLFLAELAVELCAGVPGVGWLVALVGGIFLLIALLSGIINAAGGVMKPIPFFGNITLIK